MTDHISKDNGNTFNVLRSLDKEVEYENENHVVPQPVKMTDFWNRRIAWLDRYLGVRKIETRGSTSLRLVRRRGAGCRWDYVKTGASATPARPKMRW